jgi:DNA polymerase III epsilon subunit-like protein
VFISALTTGPDQHEHELLEIAVLNAAGQTLLHTAVAPTKIHTAEPESLVKANYSAGDWAPSPFSTTIAKQIQVLLAGAILVGHDTQFTMRFVHHLLKETLGTAEKVDTRFIDTVTLMWEQLVPLGLTNLTLEDASFFLRLPFKPNHSALDDARAARVLYLKLLRAGPLQRLWWKWAAPKKDS